MISVRDSLEYPLHFNKRGKHVFGGRPRHRGVRPAGSRVPVHHVLSLDLSDANCPFSSDQLRFLPLYFPLSYENGGGEMQYEVINDKLIRIIHMTSWEPDDKESDYMNRKKLPKARFSVGKPFGKEEGFGWRTYTLGGDSQYVTSSEIFCHHESCESLTDEPKKQLLSTIPPISLPHRVGGWGENEGMYLFFYFWICMGCQSVIVASGGT